MQRTLNLCPIANYWRGPHVYNPAKDSLRKGNPGISRIIFQVLSFLAILVLLQISVFAQNSIVTENQKTGAPASEWDISREASSGSSEIAGYTTDISYNRGEKVRFKIKTASTSYTVRIYRIGYYQGKGARKIANATITASLPQIQPEGFTDPVTKLYDCGNWAESASWTIPSDAVSGVYLARLTLPNGGASHVIFIVRNDASTSDLFYKTSDATWQAYNEYGGTNLYSGPNDNLLTRGYKVSYNRPFQTTTGDHGAGKLTWFFASEYAMVRWLERNGYDVSYTTCVDTERRGSLIRNHDVLLSVGHDEYWSGGMRANVEAARNAGVNLAFFSGNEIYWKTRFESSGGVQYRTMVCYKDGIVDEIPANIHCLKCDPVATAWTGQWRAGCEFPIADGCKPENSLSGQIGWVAAHYESIKIPSTYKKYRFWRNTSVANLNPGQSVTLPPGILGYEWDYEQDNAKYPEGRVRMSETTVDNKTHKLSLYRHSSGALVFGAGTIQWAWALDSIHDVLLINNMTYVPNPYSKEVQQATVNLFADMDSKPSTLQSGLVYPTTVTDSIPPVTDISSPANSKFLAIGVPVTITGTASEASSGVVAGVELSFDNGTTWKEVNGTTSWTYTWIPTTVGSINIRSRSYDDMANLEKTITADNKITVNVVVPLPITVTIPDAKAFPFGVAVNTVYPSFYLARSIQITALPVGGIGTLTFLWSNGATTQSISVSPTNTTTYTVTVKDAIGTTKTASKTINVYGVTSGPSEGNSNQFQVCFYNETINTTEFIALIYMFFGAELGTCSDPMPPTSYNNELKGDSDVPATVNPLVLLKGTKAEGDIKEMEVKVLPNPTYTLFTLSAKSGNTTDNISMRVMDVYGKIIENRSIRSGQVVQFGEKYLPGFYVAEIIQGRRKVSVKLIKQSN